MTTKKSKMLLSMLVAAGFLLFFPGNYVLADENLSGDLSVQQQVTKTITGTVTDAQGEPLIGVSVGVQGTSTGAITDQNGRYSLQVQGDSQILRFSYLGYKPFTATANKNQINVTLEEDSQILSEVVITAEFGLKRVANSVGSSVQNIKASDITESGRDNFISALQGRVSGLNMVSSGGGPGASTSVTLRSATSLSGSNQPLYVVDGVPLNNSSFDAVGGFTGTETYASRYLDFSSRGNDLNPEDIESMTILKGAAAAALYGSKASNGAIIITTRKGQAGSGKVSYNNSFRWDNSYGIPDRQTKYANGAYGVTNYYNAAAFGGPYPEGTEFYDNIGALLRTGFTSRHNLAVEGGSEKMTARATASILRQEGTIKTTDLHRNNVSVLTQGQVTSWFRFEASLLYAGSTNNKAEKGGYSPIYRASRWPIHDDMRNYLHSDGMHMRYPERYIDSDVWNPFFMLNKNKYYDIADRIHGSLSATINPIKTTFLRVNYGFDVGAQTFEASEHPYWRNDNQILAPGRGGTYNMTKANFNEKNLDIIAGWNDDLFNKKLNLQLQVGYHQDDNENTRLATFGQNYAVADLMSINNCEPSTIVAAKTMTTYRLQALFAQAMIGYNNLAFLTLRGRNDWSSTLPKNNNRYFYPAAELAVVVSSFPFMKYVDFLSYLKLRGSISRVGKDASPLAINPQLIPTTRTGGGYKYDFTGPNLGLVPEMSTQKDIGFDMRLFNDRVNLDFSYYNTYCKDQIVSGFRMSYATGFVLNTRNVGEFKSWGWDGHIDGDIVRTKDWLFNLGINLTHTGSEITALPVESYYDAYTWVSGNLRGGAMVGQPLNVIMGDDFQRNDAGDVLIDPSTGSPLLETTLKPLGDLDPKLRFGIVPRLRYKNWSLSALAEGKLGATVVNATMRQMFQQGNSWESVKAREAGPFVFKGVIKDGLENTANPTINNIAITSGLSGTTLYTGADPDWIEKDIKYLRLREIRLSYTIPPVTLKSITRGFISNASIFVTGNDLFTLTNYSGVDAVGNVLSASAGGADREGYDWWALPNPRGFTFGISLTF